MTLRDDDKPPTPAPAGRVVHDERGNAVWQPAATVDSGELQAMLRTDQLALAETGEHRRPDCPEEFDPYGRATVTPKARGRKTRTDLRALSAQILAERARKADGD